MKAQLKNSFAKCDIFLLLMLLSGVVLRIIYLAEYSANINFDIACGADVREYFDRMTEMISGRFFPEKPDIHGIFYPLFSSLFLRISGSIVLLRILQSVLNFFSFFILYILLGKYRVNLKIRRIFLAISMLYTVQFFHSAEIISESLLVPLITVLLCLLYKVRYGEKNRMLFAGAAGGVAGLAVLTHGSMLLLTLAYPVLLWYEKRKKCAVMMLASLMLLTGAFCAVKSASYGRVCFVQENGAFNFYLGNSKLADGSCRIRPGLEWRKLHANAEKEALERGISKDALFLGRSLHYIFTEPVGELKLLLRKAVLFFHFKELISGADPEGLLYEIGRASCRERVCLRV